MLLLRTIAVFLWGVAGCAAAVEVDFPGPPTEAVVLDIGHSCLDCGAIAPAALNGVRMTEFDFWYEYCYYTKKVIEAAGYPCVVCNRGMPPEDPKYKPWAERADVQHLGKPVEFPLRRAASIYSPDRVAAGIVSADYAVYRKAPAMVFLHHNSQGLKWSTKGMTAIILANRHNGVPLAESIAHVLNTTILNHGMDNGGKECSVETRHVDASRGGGWLNVCDDAGIPAVILEAAFMNNRHHMTFLSNPATARKYAEAVGHGVVHYLKNNRRAPHKRPDFNVPDEGSYGYKAESRQYKWEIPGARYFYRELKSTAGWETNNAGRGSGKLAQRITGCKRSKKLKTRTSEHKPRNIKEEYQQEQEGQ